MDKLLWLFVVLFMYILTAGIWKLTKLVLWSIIDKHQYMHSHSTIY